MREFLHMTFSLRFCPAASATYQYSLKLSEAVSAGRLPKHTPLRRAPALGHSVCEYQYKANYITCADI